MDIDFGQILPNPTDLPYSSTRNYEAMESCIDQYNSEWLSLEDNNRGHALPGYNEDGSAKTSDYWRCIVNVYRTGVATEEARNAAALANEKADLANTKAEYAQTQGNHAKTQGDYAKDQGDYAKNMADHPSYVGEDGYWYHWNYASQRFVKGTIARGEDLDYSTLTEEEKAELASKIEEEIEREGSYSVIPIDESAITTTSVYKKNSILCINGVVYITNKQTQNLPFPVVMQGNKIVTNNLYGRTCVVLSSQTKSQDWDIWIDASNDIRFKKLEDRVAHLETIINSL